jgi:hypothetical protein
MENPSSIINKLSDNLNLSDPQEKLLQILMKADGFQLNAEFCRSKLRSVIPGCRSPFSRIIKTLEKKGVVLIGYELNGTKVIKLSPEEEIKRIAAKESNVPGNKKLLKLSKEAEKNLQGDIIAFLKSRNAPVAKAAVQEYINSRLSPQLLSNYQFSRVLQNLETAGTGLIRTFGLSEKSNNKATSYYSYKGKEDGEGKAESENAPPPAAAAGEDGRFVIEMDIDDMATLAAALRRFSIIEDPGMWLKGKVENIILNLLENRLHLTDIVFDNDFISKYSWLKENCEDKDKMNVKETVRQIIRDFVCGEFDKRYVFNQVNGIVTQTSDPKLLHTVKNMIERRIKDLEGNVR